MTRRPISTSATVRLWTPCCQFSVSTMTPIHWWLMTGLHQVRHYWACADTSLEGSLTISSSDHLWQTSKMLGFSHNIALVGLQCENRYWPIRSIWPITTNREEEWNIMVMHQEKPISMPACGDPICPLSTFIDRLQPVLDVDFEFECNHDVLYPDSMLHHYH